MPPSSKDQIMSCLTQKKAVVVSDMLTSLEAQPNSPEFAAARREFLDLIYAKYAQGGGVFIDNIFKPTSDAGSAAA
jgi:hypothetical protein